MGQDRAWGGDKPSGRGVCLRQGCGRGRVRHGRGVARLPHGSLPLFGTWTNVFTPKTNLSTLWNILVHLRVTFTALQVTARSLADALEAASTDAVTGIASLAYMRSCALLTARYYDKYAALASYCQRPLITLTS